MGSAEKSATAVARLALISGVLVSFVFLISGLLLQTRGSAVGGLRASLLLDIGILFLLATPVVRVIVLAVGYVRERETTLAMLAFCILMLLGAGVAIGLGGE